MWLLARGFLSTGPGVIAVILALALGWGWHKARERDQWWRQEIAKSVKPAADAMAQGDVNDEAMIELVGKADAERIEAQSKLNKSQAPVDGCAAVPARCLGLQ